MPKFRVKCTGGTIHLKEVKKKMVSIRIAVVDNTNINRKMKGILSAVKKGVKLATEDGVLWIHQSVFDGQEHVGEANYPDVTPVTKMIKARAGKQLVGIWTGGTKSSFRSAVSGFTGRIAGTVYEYFGSKWHIDSLFMQHRKKKTEEIIKSEVEKAAK